MPFRACFNPGMRLAPIALAVSLLLAPPALSAGETTQQRAEELDKLFAQLRKPGDDAAARQIENRIWLLWMQSDSSAADLILARATAAMNAGDFRRSEELLNRLIADNPSYAEAWNKRATLYFLMGRFDDSLADIVRTLDLEPRHFGALSGRGMIYARQGKLREALASYREALAINPHMPGATAAVRQLEQLFPDL
jgi:tetratricopeptide (TPR) repeat protein